jgi:photosystem II PsbU protein
MFRLVVCLALCAIAAAFSATGAVRSSRVTLSMKNDMQKIFAAGLVGASMFLGGNNARAEIDYDGIKYLGGGDKIDLNNANVRAYLKVPGMYPTLAGKVVSQGPFKTVGDVYSIPNLSSKEKEVLKANEGRFVALEVKPEYDIDKINNGLYR